MSPETSIIKYLPCCFKEITVQLGLLFFTGLLRFVTSVKACYGMTVVQSMGDDPPIQQLLLLWLTFIVPSCNTDQGVHQS